MPSQDKFHQRTAPGGLWHVFAPLPGQPLQDLSGPHFQDGGAKCQRASGLGMLPPTPRHGTPRVASGTFPAVFLQWSLHLQSSSSLQFLPNHGKAFQKCNSYHIVCTSNHLKRGHSVPGWTGTPQFSIIGCPQFHSFSWRTICHYSTLMETF